MILWATAPVRKDGVERYGRAKENCEQRKPVEDVKPAENW